MFVEVGFSASDLWDLYKEVLPISTINWVVRTQENVASMNERIQGDICDIG